MADLRLSFAMTPYDRVLPLISGEVKPDGITLEYMGMFSWPYETATAMHRLVSSGVFNNHPDIKFITHYCGSMVPYFEKRIKNTWPLISGPGQTIQMNISDMEKEKIFSRNAVNLLKLPL